VSGESVNAKAVFAAVGVLALAAGTALWFGTRAPAPAATAVGIAAPALYAATFADTDGRPKALGQYQGTLLVLNFWATWCAPCREEMPAFKRLQARWAGRGVQFVGLANEEPRRVEKFGQELGINYPLLVGGDEVGDLSKRLGNRLGVLPHTVIVDRNGGVIESRVGPYSEAALEKQLAEIAANSR
jgi:thiol-disulfide isomerase/thioredoxin